MNPVNDAPIAVADNFNTLENQQLVLDAASGVLANDIDIDNATNELSATVTVPPLDGTLWSQRMVASRIPDPGFAGVVTFEYEVSDGVDAEHCLKHRRR